MNKLVPFALIILLISCSNPTKQKNMNLSESFNTLLDQYYREGLRLNPIEATYAGFKEFNNSFPNFLSDDYKAEKKAYYSRYLDLITGIPDENLSESEKMSKSIIQWECEINLEELKFRQDFFPIDQMWTVNLTMGQFASGAGAQPFITAMDYWNWIERLEGYHEWMLTAIQKMQEGINLGYVLPKSLIVKIIPQLKALTSEKMDEHLFYMPVKNMPDSIKDGKKQQIIEAYNQVLSQKIIPAYNALYLFMQEEYLKAGRETSGYNDVPDGIAYYSHQIKKYTTTNMTAQEIHELGLKEVARIRSEMEKVMDLVGYEGELLTFFDYVRNNKQLMPYDKPNEVIDHFYEIYNRMKPRLDDLFDVKPKTAFEIRRTEAFREASASAEYSQGSVDGTRPGIFYVPIPDVKNYNTYSDESLFLHEAIPGHHYQISLTQESQDLPEFRKTLWYSGYGEGWALYVESLGKELGLYTDPFQYFGMLSAEMHRAIRLVVDTGIHTMGWTREKAIEYSMENEAESEASIISEIERYMANPGQALSYKIGQLKIRELRSRAEEKLGDRFNIQHFHDQVLETGCVPLALLESKVNNWIDASLN